MTDSEAAAWAERFWALAGALEPFPRSLESPVAWAVPLAIVKLPHLALSDLRLWCTERGIGVHLPGKDRPLRACLLARGGRGLVVLDGIDPEDERRYSLAHEVAHFMVDYLQPRQRTLEVLGEAARDVLDGCRPPTLEERLTGLLRGVELGVYADLMERSPSIEVTRPETLEAEDRAERIALELLAPREVVLARLAQRRVRWREVGALGVARRMLMQEFGLPSGAAEEYGRRLVLSRRAARSFREWLGA